ncbi:MAG TPA: nickel-binding protein [Chitinophagaceae bacterium]
MPIYMDVHIVPGVKAKDVAKAHQLDVFHQKDYGCKCMTYWIDEERENIFCLIEAPDKEAVEEMHSRAHGLVPNKIIEVNSTLVEAFLGRIYDPAEAETDENGLKIFAEPSLRILLVTKITDPVLLQHQLGRDKATELLEKHNNLIRKNIGQYGGREIEHGGHDFIVSFPFASKAVSCALTLHSELSDEEKELMKFAIGLNAGEPVEKSNRLFGDTIQLASYMCSIARDSRISVTTRVKELVSKDHFQDAGNNFATLSPQDESILELLFCKLEEKWQDAEFDMDEYCQSMAMSKSQLYRKTISLTGLSPNLLLKEFRLEKAKELLKKKRDNIAQITFDAGFTSPSYFTKCFKKKYGLLPMAYIDLLH